jgi:hypothetical protein
MAKAVWRCTLRHFANSAMRDADYELAGQIEHLPVKQKAEKKQRLLSQKERLVKPVRLKFS